MRSLQKQIKEYYGKSRIRKHGFWFVDIPRTSSTSIRIELGHYYGSPYGKKNTYDKTYSSSQIFDDHITAKNMRTILGPKLWQSIFTFTIVRNPWDRMVSLYNWRKKVDQKISELSFREYVLEFDRAKEGEQSEFFRNKIHLYGLYDYILDEDDSILVNFVAKYERRQLDIRHIATQIGCMDLGKLLIQRASQVGLHYSQYYDEDTKQIIAKHYKKDIDVFSYEFDEAKPPT